MTDLKLVAPDQPTPFERMLLDAVANESPTAEQRLRVRQALGLPALAVAPAPALQAGRRAGLLKASAAGLVAVSAVVLLVLSGVGRKPQPVLTMPLVAAPVVAPNAASAPTRLDEMPPEPVAAALPPVERDSAPAFKARSKSLARISGAPLSTSANSSDLSEQLRLIDAARAAVAAGNANAASAAIASYRSRFPRGPFGQEAAVLQIETADLQGNHAQAASLARAFLARHPNSPHVSLVQRIAERAQ